MTTPPNPPTPDPDASAESTELSPGRTPYTPQKDETVQCLACQKFNDTDAIYCDQCGEEIPDASVVGGCLLSSPPARRRGLPGDRAPLLSRQPLGPCPAALESSAPAKLHGGRVLALVGVVWLIAGGVGHDGCS
jgi:hypothetical protein